MNGRSRLICSVCAGLVLVITSCTPTSSYSSDDDMLYYVVGALSIVAAYAAVQAGADPATLTISPTVPSTRGGTCEYEESACNAARARCRAREAAGGGTCAIPCECGGN